MIVSEFVFEDKKYVIELQDDLFLVFYRCTYDSFSFFSDPDKVSRITYDVKRPVTLLRLIFKKIKMFLFENKINYFYLTVDDVKRKKIYIRLLKRLSGYRFQVSDDTINVFKK